MGWVLRNLIFSVFVLLELGSAFTVQALADPSCKIVDRKVDCPKPTEPRGPAPLEKGDDEAFLDYQEILKDPDVMKVLKQKGYVE